MPVTLSQVEEDEEDISVASAELALAADPDEWRLRRTSDPLPRPTTFFLTISIAEALRGEGPDTV